MHAKEVIQIIEQDFANNKLAKLACTNIFNSFRHIINKDHLNNLSFRELKSKAQVSDDKIISQVITYFVGDRVNLLVAYYEFYDENNDEWFSLDTQDVLEATRNNIFYHPYTENIVNDFIHKIYIKYSISDNGRELTS